MIPINTILYTKDGRKVGNAIVYGYNKDKITLRTDYGSFVTMTLKEIDDSFYGDRGPFERGKIAKHKFFKEI